MNEEIKLVSKYCAINKLSVNFKKTNYMLITSWKKKIHLNIHNIECKSYIKYLGIYLDEHLQWESQIQHVNNKLAKNVGIINKLRHYLDFHMLKQLYYTGNPKTLTPGPRTPTTDPLYGTPPKI